MSLEGRKVAIAVAFALGVQAMPAHAQVGAAPGAQLEEIKVTARKIEERLQDVPIAVSVVDDSLIERTVSRSVYDVARMVPNLGFNQTYGRAFDRPAMRGQGSVIGDRTVGLFVDGIYVPGSISSTDLSNVARVEVLRGPQTALFGRGTLSGAINYVTKRPSAKTEGRADVTVGDHGLLDASASVSGPITDDASLRYYVGLSSHDFGGYYTNTGFDGGDIGVEHTAAGSAALYWEPSEKFDAVLRTSYSKDNDGIWALSLLKTLNCFTTNPGARGGYYCGEVPVIPTNGVQTDFNPGGIADPGTNKLTRRTSLDMRYRFSDMEFTSITAYTNEDERWTYDDGQQNLQVTATGAPAPYRYNGPNPGFLSMITRNWRSTSQEFHLASDAQQRLRWMVGAFGYWETYDSTTGNPTVTNGVIGPVPVNPRKKTENLALFGRIEYDFATAWTGALEGRAARDTFNYGLPTGEQERDFQSNTPRVSLTWKATEATTFYASYAQGTRPGDMNTNLFNAAVPPAERERLSGYIEIEEETADNYELGVKSWLFDRRVYAELAIFDIEWDKQQLTASETYRNAAGTLTPISLVVNAGKTRVKGLEFSFAWNLTDSLAFSGSYGLADAKFKEFCDVNQIPLTGTCSVEGNHPPNTPKDTGALSLVHHLPLAGGELQTSVDYTYQGTRYDQVGNYAETGSSERLGARVAFEHENFSVAVWGKNLTDDRSADSIVRFVNFDAPTVSNRAFQVRYPNGRTWGMSFGVKF